MDHLHRELEDTKDRNCLSSYDGDAPGLRTTKGADTFLEAHNLDDALTAVAAIEPELTSTGGDSHEPREDSEPPALLPVGAAVPHLAAFPLGSNSGYGGQLAALAYSPTGAHIAAGVRDVITVWNARVDDVLYDFRGHSGTISSLAFSPGGGQLTSGASDGCVVLWDLIAGEPIRSLDAHANYVDFLAYSPDGKLFASAGSSEGTVKLWEAETGNLHAAMEEYYGNIIAIVFSPNGEQLTSVTAEGMAHVWNTSTGSLICDLRGHQPMYAFCSVVYSHDGRRLVTSSQDGTARVWDAALGHEIMTLNEEADGAVWAATFSADGKELYYISSDGIIKAFHSDSGVLIQAIDCEGKAAMSITFSADGRLLAASGKGFVVTVWDMATRCELVQLTGHTDTVNYISFSCDNEYIATASNDGTVRKWALPALAATV
ncbi:WD40 repeat-like protein [Daedalea quercina L-15889]|uniref:WD40 repeat-like protein n=1 Tax=Daedalea quercina L-15889 TaxID=1314783 RepID=A0A165M1F3_9APHY|nr:WD40 repeat-like protein [Daedalea quercina L-15889]